jgi:hypothetical protein
MAGMEDNPYKAPQVKPAQDAPDAPLSWWGFVRSLALLFVLTVMFAIAFRFFYWLVLESRFKAN